MSFAFITLAIWGCAALALVVRSAHLIRPGHHGVVERLGRYHGTVEPGLHLVIPFVDRVTPIQGGQRSIPVGGRSYLCREISPVYLEGTLTFDVINPTRALYGVVDLDHALSTSAQGFTSSALATLAARYTPSDAAYVSAHVRRQFDEFAESWGVRVVAYELHGSSRSEPPALEKRSTSDVVSVGGASTPVAISSD